jgi:hypothetical protein
MATDHNVRRRHGSGLAAIPKRVLNAGSGPYSPRKLHAIFSTNEWQQVRLDADAQAKPDFVGSISDMRGLIPDSSFDAVWSSHSLEHLYAHEVSQALTEFRRVLKHSGFALITTPDLEAAAQLVADGRIEEVAYVSRAGPITALDMIFGHSAAIALGNRFMSHRTGFTCERLGRLILEAGFPEALIVKNGPFDLWALAIMPGTNRDQLIQEFQMVGINFAE